MIIFDTHTTACFTGHRTYDGQRAEELRAAIRELYGLGYRTFLSGMAKGFDLAAAAEVLALRASLPDIRLIAVLPFDRMGERFSARARKQYDEIMGHAAEVIILADEYQPWAYANRNNFLVENSSATIAYFDGSKGGTAYTVQRAVRALHRYINLYPNPQQELGF